MALQGRRMRRPVKIAVRRSEAGCGWRALTRINANWEEKPEAELNTKEHKEHKDLLRG